MNLNTESFYQLLLSRDFKLIEEFSAFLLNTDDVSLAKKLVDIAISIFSDNKYKIIKTFDDDIIEKTDDFIMNVLDSGFFGNQPKVFVIFYPSTKASGILQQIIKKLPSDVKMIILSEYLDKKSSMRKLFEDNKDLSNISIYRFSNEMITKLTIKYIQNKQLHLDDDFIHNMLLELNYDFMQIENTIHLLDCLQGDSMFQNKDIIKQMSIGFELINFSDIINAFFDKNAYKLFLYSQNPEFNIIQVLHVLIGYLKKIQATLIDVQNGSDIMHAIQNQRIMFADVSNFRSRVNKFTLTKCENLILKLYFYHSKAIFNGSEYAINLFLNSIIAC